MRSAPRLFAVIGARAREVEALLLPRACLGCERPLPAADAHRACCALCLYRMRPLGAPACGRCGQPTDRWTLHLIDSRGRDARPAASGGTRRRGKSCAFCKDWSPELAWATSAVWLDDGPARNLVHALKYGGWRLAAPVMAERVRALAGARLRGLDALVPIPLGRTRLRERGHNQAELLARALGQELGVPVLAGALLRTRETRSQTRLAPAERRRNVAGAFAAAGPGARGLSVALVDDVLTTGATLAAAAQALAGLEPASVGAVTFARALVPA